MVVGQKEQSALAPCNTQAQTAGGDAKQANSRHDLTRKGIDVLVDWVSITYYSGLIDVLERYGAADWPEIGHGWKGYKRGCIQGNVKIWWDGKEEQGVSVQVSGQGCRELEASGIIEHGNWVEWLRQQLAVGRFSRLDVAMDERTPSVGEALLTRERIQQAIDAKTIATRYEKVEKYECQSLHEVAGGGWTRSFGKEQSETRITFYDKAAEQGIEESYHWMRCEIRCRREKAHELARQLVDNGLSHVAAVVNGLVDFKEGSRPEQTGGRNYREWLSCAWWSAFVGGVAKARLVVRPAVRTLEEAKAWLHRNVAPLLAVVCDTERGRAIKDFLPKLLESGRERRKINPKYDRMLTQFRSLMLPALS